ncbi:hypothetical protein DPMN_183748 [Dreissena polymorpha]|uniref:Uncharacterized protein n=1 Tax=Dreissena polymorpha TaxID=45954 RepID=A0A9D4DIZ5_DREPO|nr:hypothetical protein DPMN_183748 [Dreissena polymorpha]
MEQKRKVFWAAKHTDRQTYRPIDGLYILPLYKLHKQRKEKTRTVEATKRKCHIGDSNQRKGTHQRKETDKSQRKESATSQRNERVTKQRKESARTSYKKKGPQLKEQPKERQRKESARTQGKERATTVTATKRKGQNCASKEKKGPQL